MKISRRERKEQLASNCSKTIKRSKREVFSELMESITKFSIVIGSPRAYLSCNRRAITWVSNYRCPI